VTDGQFIFFTLLLVGEFAGLGFLVKVWAERILNEIEKTDKLGFLVKAWAERILNEIEKTDKSG
jgi:hypothetical protein